MVRPEQVQKIRKAASLVDLHARLGRQDSPRGRQDRAVLEALRRTSSYAEWAEARDGSSFPYSDAWR